MPSSLFAFPMGNRTTGFAQPSVPSLECTMLAIIPGIMPVDLQPDLKGELIELRPSM
jgi:hypothetical protein